MSPTTTGRTIQLTVRLEKPAAARLEALAEAMTRPGLAVSKTDALRMAVLEGLAVLEGREKTARRK